MGRIGRNQVDDYAQRKRLDDGRGRAVALPEPGLRAGGLRPGTQRLPDPDDDHVSLKERQNILSTLGALEENRDGKSGLTRGGF